MVDAIRLGKVLVEFLLSLARLRGVLCFLKARCATLGSVDGPTRTPRAVTITATCTWEISAVSGYEIKVSTCMNGHMCSISRVALTNEEVILDHDVSSSCCMAHVISSLHLK